MKYREVVTYKHYFEDFFKEQSPKVRDKIIKVLDIVEQIRKAERLMSDYNEEKRKDGKNVSKLRHQKHSQNKGCPALGNSRIPQGQRPYYDPNAPTRASK